MERRAPHARRCAPAAGQYLPRLAARSRRTVSVSWRTGTSALAGADAQGLQGDLAHLAVPGSRVVDAAGPQPRPALRRPEHPRRVEIVRTPPALLRPAGVAVEESGSSAQSA